MNGTEIYDYIIEYLGSDTGCEFCNTMGYECNWKESIPEKEKEIYEENCKTCRNFLKNKFSQLLGISRETTSNVSLTDEGKLFYENLIEKLRTENDQRDCQLCIDFNWYNECSSNECKKNFRKKFNEIFELKF